MFCIFIVLGYKGVVIPYMGSGIKPPGVAVRVSESPYAVLGREMTPLLVINIKSLCTSHFDTTM